MNDRTTTIVKAIALSLCAMLLTGLAVYLGLTLRDRQCAFVWQEVCTDDEALNLTDALAANQERKATP